MALNDEIRLAQNGFCIAQHGQFVFSDENLRTAVNLGPFAFSGYVYGLIAEGNLLSDFKNNAKILRTISDTGLAFGDHKTMASAFSGLKAGFQSHCTKMNINHIATIRSFLTAIDCSSREDNIFYDIFSDFDAQRIATGFVRRPKNFDEAKTAGFEIHEPPRSPLTLSECTSAELAAVFEAVSLDTLAAERPKAANAKKAGI